MNTNTHKGAVTPLYSNIRGLGFFDCALKNYQRAKHHGAQIISHEKKTREEVENIQI